MHKGIFNATDLEKSKLFPYLCTGLCITFGHLTRKKQTSMKKILTSVIILAAIAVMPANAQVKFGVKGGLNSTSLKIDYEHLNSKSAEGWFLGPTVKASFPLGVVNLGADGAVLYDERRSKAAYEGVEESIKQKSIIIPLNVRMNFNLLKILGAYVATGPQFGFNVGHEDFSMGSISSVQNTFQLKKSQFSWNVGVGVTVFSHLEVGVAYNIGIGKTGELKDMSKSEIIDSPKQKSWVISAAYYF